MIKTLLYDFSAATQSNKLLSNFNEFWLKMFYEEGFFHSQTLSPFGFVVVAAAAAPSAEKV